MRAWRGFASWPRSPEQPAAWASAGQKRKKRRSVSLRSRRSRVVSPTPRRLHARILLLDHFCVPGSTNPVERSPETTKKLPRTRRSPRVVRSGTDTDDRGAHGNPCDHRRRRRRVPTTTGAETTRGNNIQSKLAVLDRLHASRRRQPVDASLTRIEPPSVDRDSSESHRLRAVPSPRESRRRARDHAMRENDAFRTFSFLAMFASRVVHCRRRARGPLPLAAGFGPA